MVLFTSVVLAIVATPFVVYISAKLGAYGYLMGCRKFRENYPVTGECTNEG